MWVRVALAAGCFASIMGFARLAYGLLVPAMQHALGGNYKTYGAIATANFVGYLAGAVLATRVARRPDRARIDLAMLSATAILLALAGLSPNTLVLGVLRFAVGVTSGIALSLTLALATEAIPPARRGLAAAIVWAGGAAGVALAGSASFLVRASDPTGWRLQWLAMGLAGAVLTLAFSRTVGGRFVASERHDDGGALGLYAPGGYLPLTAAYFAYGFGYIVILTFLGAALVRIAAVPPGLIWVVVGLAGAAGATLWGPLLDRMRSGVPVALAAGLCAAGAALVASGNVDAAIVGAFAIGVSFIGVPAMVGALVQQREAPNRYPRAFAAITLVLAVGQIIGPFAGGQLADALGPPAALLLGAGALTIAAALALAYRRPAEAFVPSLP